VQVDVWSDVVCPWCYLGEHRLARALDRLEWGDDVSVKWRPFQLDPRAPREPQDLRRTLERKYGPGAFDVMTQRLTALGRDEGLDFRFELAQRVNTLDAQRLLSWTGESTPTRQMPLARQLFLAYFTEGRNVADHDVLVALSTEVGNHPRSAATILSSDAFVDHIAAEREIALDRAIAGVPTFVVADRWQIPGAQDVDTMVAVLERARRTLAA
jgi:predicted DsbA family dithiol-disulfide isomerase